MCARARMPMRVVCFACCVCMCMSLRVRDRDSHTSHPHPRLLLPHRIRGDEISPGLAAQSDSDLDAYLAEHLESAYHPCGTCKMGAPDDDMAVVTSNGSVRGISGLRVVDSSIFPLITNGNLNGPTIMVAEKLSDAIVGATPLAEVGELPAADNAPRGWVDPRWKDTQRESPALKRTHAP